MKRKMLVFVSSVLVSMCFIVAPMQTQVLAQDSEESIESVRTKTVTQSKVYQLNDSIDASIRYNVGGWSGTLYLVATQSTGDHILATYRGTVHCHGYCAMSSETVLDEED